MKRALQLVIVISIGVSLAALWRFWWLFAGYNVSEALNYVLPHPEDLVAKAQLRLYEIYSLLSLGTTVWLIVAYRKNYRTK